MAGMDGFFNTCVFLHTITVETMMHDDAIYSRLWYFAGEFLNQN